MTWWVALIVAVCAGLSWGFALLAVCPEVTEPQNAETQTGNAILAGAMFAIGLFVALVAA